MTEEIIIDGVNVAGCCYFFKPDNSCDNAKTTSCYCYKTSCYYKQLQRLKQENEALLKQKNGVMATNIKYFMALEEIREIVGQKCNEHLDGATSSDCEDCFLDDIRYKINEVIGNEVGR